MENVKVILENGIETPMNGIFYVFNSKYYFMYTQGEIVDEGYVRVYISQVCKEVKNTPTGPVDTGYMLGLEISNSEEWSKVQESVAKIVSDKKNGEQSTEIQYLPINMIVNLKIISKNNFKLLTNIIENNFNVTLNTNYEVSNISTNESEKQINTKQEQENDSNNLIENEVIIDYRAKFFEEQEKLKVLEQEIQELKQKINDIKNVIG